MIHTCVTCKHHSKTDTHRCSLFPDMVTGEGRECLDIRNDVSKCGPDGTSWERRQNISAIVDQAPITTKTAIETPMATISQENDPAILQRIKDGKPPFDDYNG